MFCSLQFLCASLFYNVVFLNNCGFIFLVGLWRLLWVSFGWYTRSTRKSHRGTHERLTYHLSHFNTHFKDKQRTLSFFYSPYNIRTNSESIETKKHESYGFHRVTRSSDPRGCICCFCGHCCCSFSLLLQEAERFVPFSFLCWFGTGFSMFLLPLFFARKCMIWDIDDQFDSFR